MTESAFNTAFKTLTGNAPFPWQSALYRRFIAGDFPASCNLPTGLGKTSVVAVWLLALATRPDLVPRRLVYVVNRRTVVDQTTTEAEKIRENIIHVAEVDRQLIDLCSTFPETKSPYKPPSPLALSTLRGQFADNREWSADPSRPAIIVGTVDMIGSRLLFSGYGIGFKLKPLHAGFLGQDALLVHDEAHLEKPFQDLLETICQEQRTGRTPDFRPLKLMALTATPRSGAEPFELTEAEAKPPEVVPDDNESLHIVWRRLRAKKTLTPVPVPDEKQVVPKIIELAHKRGQESAGSPIIIFVRTVDAVTEVQNGLKAKRVPETNISTLTGTMRGLERNRQADPRDKAGDPVFARFLKPPKPDEEPWAVTPQPGAVYLICTAAGEVGVDISADHMVCDLTPFDSMAQRFGRVNRYGTRGARIDVVHEARAGEKKKDEPFDQRRWLALEQLKALHSDASPYAIGRLPLADRIAAFTPTPVVLPTSDILFDAWALTTIRDKLPGRPKVEPYLHGKTEWEPAETQVGWREEVGRITGDLLKQYNPEDLLDDYPLKPHELLRDNSKRVFDRLTKLKAVPETPVWLVADDDSVTPTTLGELLEAGKEEIERKTVLLPPKAGGLLDGMLNHGSDTADDVADEWYDERGRKRRVRLWDTDPAFEAKSDGMRAAGEPLDIRPTADDDESTGTRYWYRFELPKSGDSGDLKGGKKPVRWCVHVEDVVERTREIVAVAPLSEELKAAIIFAARFHDHGKRRKQFQIVLGNYDYPTTVLAKSGKKGGRVSESYRHEFGSLIDILNEDQPHLAEFKTLSEDMQEVVLHLIAVHHGYGRPHFPTKLVFDPEVTGPNVEEIAAEVPRRFARLQRKYGRWGLAYLESLLRAADYAASANPSEFVEVSS